MTARLPVRAGRLTHLVVGRTPSTLVPAPGVETGLGAPAMRALRHRLDTILQHVADLWPRCDVAQLRSGMLELALRQPEVCDATDDSLSAVLLYAAASTFHLGRELVPVVDRDPVTGLVTVATVEKVAGLVRCFRDAGLSAHSGTVYAADIFRHNFDDGVREFTHVPNLSGRSRGEIVAFFAVVDGRRGEWHAKVLTVAEVEQRRRASRTPEHRAWRDYFPTMGEACALRAIADVIPQGAARPRLATMDTDTSTQPLASLDPDDPYAMRAATRDATRDATPSRTAADDYVVTEEPLFADARAAGEEVLPGDARAFNGFGGAPIARCPTAILRGVRRWIRTTIERQVRYARLLQALTLVIDARRATTTPTAGVSS